MRFHIHCILGALTLLPLTGCLSDEDLDDGGEEEDDEYSTAVQAVCNPNTNQSPSQVIPLSEEQTVTKSGTPAGSASCKHYTLEFQPGNEITAKIHYPGPYVPVITPEQCAQTTIRARFWVNDGAGWTQLPSETSRGVWGIGSCLYPSVSYASGNVWRWAPPVQAYIVSRQEHAQIRVSVQTQSATSDALPVRVTGTYTRALAD